MSGSNNLTYKWLVGILISLLIIGSGAFMSFASARINQIEGSQSEGSSRLAALEAHYNDITARLTRIENKIDKR